MVRLSLPLNRYTSGETLASVETNRQGMCRNSRTTRMPKPVEEELPRILVHTGALKFGMFTLSGGKLSPYYLDLRVLPSFPDAFHASSNYWESLRELSLILRRSLGFQPADCHGLQSWPTLSRS